MSTARRIIAVILLWLIGLAAAGQFSKIAVPLADIRALYPAAGNQIGWLLSLVSAVGAVLGVVAGGLVDRIGPRRILIFGLALGAAMSLWQASLPGFALMLVSRVIEGGSHLIIVVAAPTLIAELSEGRYQGAAMTLWSTFFGVSFALTAWLGTPLVATSGVPVLFLAHAALLAGLMLLAAWLLPPRQRQQSETTGGIWQKHMAAYRSPFIAAPGVGWLFYTITFVALLAILPDLMPATQTTEIAGLLPLISIAASLLLVPLLLRVMSAVAVVLLGLGLATAVALSNLALAQPALLAFVLFGILGLVQGASFAAVPQLNRQTDAQAVAYGLMAQAGNLGNLIGTPLLLSTLAYGGTSAMFLLVAAIYASAILAHLVLMQIRRRYPLAE
ncbi:MFS transporter [Halovulum sp. GXIMD14793]